MCVRSNTSDDAVDDLCPCCKLFAPAVCNHQQALCINPTVHPKIYVHYFKNTQLATVNGCGYCKWAKKHPDLPPASNSGWPGCCRPPKSNESAYVPLREWPHIAKYHNMVIPKPIIDALNAHQRPITTTTNSPYITAVPVSPRTIRSNSYAKDSAHTNERIKEYLNGAVAAVNTPTGGRASPHNRRMNALYARPASPTPATSIPNLNPTSPRSNAGSSGTSGTSNSSNSPKSGPKRSFKDDSQLQGFSASAVLQSRSSQDGNGHKPPMKGTAVSTSSNGSGSSRGESGSGASSNNKPSVPLTGANGGREPSRVRAASPRDDRDRDRQSVPFNLNGLASKDRDRGMEPKAQTLGRSQSLKKKSNSISNGTKPPLPVNTHVLPVKVNQGSISPISPSRGYATTSRQSPTTPLAAPNIRDMFNSDKSSRKMNMDAYATMPRNATNTTTTTPAVSQKRGSAPSLAAVMSQFQNTSISSSSALTSPPVITPPTFKETDYYPQYEGEPTRFPPTPSSTVSSGFTRGEALGVARPPNPSPPGSSLAGTGSTTSSNSSYQEGTVVSDGFTDYLSDDSDLELQRQAEINAERAMQRALLEAEELEFKMAREQLMRIGNTMPTSNGHSSNHSNHQGSSRRTTGGATTATLGMGGMGGRGYSAGAQRTMAAFGQSVTVGHGLRR